MSEPTLFPESGFLRLKIKLAYDGTAFSGWAKQPDRRTVQEVFERAFSTVSRHQCETIVAGRTDAGVHATAQIIHVDVPVGTDQIDLAYRLNRLLDTDIRVLEIEEAPEGFHARFSALRRHYQYQIVDGNRAINPLDRYDRASWYRPLDLDRLNEASSLLLGEHDFAAFCKFREGATTIRTLETFNWERKADGLLVAQVVADAFCYSMVRNLVGAAVCVAEGRFEPSWIAEMLANRQRISDSMVFPPEGLTLVQVDYPNNAQLLARAALTIARRNEE
ncbi:MAG: tRNA pseudouridine(38-40) synthase TruA [Candidatus Nanopelagicaceae bacterium]|nr:tRNA pseudouridine(38-40) synthase TruA [Candidatus Nanopelagicaceae bacterium]